MVEGIIGIAAMIVAGCLLVILMFPETWILLLGMREIRKMAETLPEADRERWINEQSSGLVKSKKQKEKKHARP